MKNEHKILSAIAVVCFVLTFGLTLQVKNVTKNYGERGVASPLRSSEMQVLYQKEQEKNEALYKDYLRVSTDLDKYIAASKDTSATTKLLKEQLDNAELVAGLKEVTGQGVTVKLSDSKLTAVEGTDESMFWLHDGDLLLVVNELKDAGAEAIAINEQRLTAISEIRCIGAVVSINNNRIGEPFVIKAIGDSKTLESALLFRGGIVTELTAYGIQFDIKKSDNIVIPAYKGALNFKYATPNK